MESTREIYWNIGQVVVIPMYLLALAAFGVMAWGFWQRMQIWLQGKALYRFDRCEERLKQLVSAVFGQVKVSRVKDGGMPHALFFWGFLTLFAGTLMVMAQYDIFSPLLHINVLSGEFYKAFSLVLDIAGIVALLMLVGLAIRRFLIQPNGLVIVKDDYIALLLLSAILITGFFVEGARIAANELLQHPELTFFSPGGLLAAQLFVNINRATLLIIHKTLWLFHFVLVLCFFCAIPYTKLRHILTTTANAFLAPLEPKGTIASINLEDESIEQYGAATITDLTWKDIFDADACTSCKRCQDRCPAHTTDKPLSPMKVVKQVGELAEANSAGNLIETVSQDAIWSCTTCFACQDICPANIEHVNKIIEMRRHLSLIEGAFPGDEARTAFRNIEVNGNPFGLAFASRGDWSYGLPVTRMADDSEVDILYFVGCYASFDKRNHQVAKSFVKICHAAGIKVGILGKEEKCCGEPVRKLGNEYLYQMLAAENIELIKTYGVKKIVTTCPHCFNTLRRDYKDLGLDIAVEHYSTFVNRLIADERLELKPVLNSFKLTYHDSCYMGRYMDIIDEPRRVIKAAGGRLSEMKKSGYDSFCCGGGGGRILTEEKLGSRINIERVKMAEATGASLLVSNCPFCLSMFEDGIKSGGLEGKLNVKDLAEIVAEGIGDKA